MLILLIVLNISIRPGYTYGGGGRRSTRGYGYSFIPRYEDDDFQYGIEGDIDESKIIKPVVKQVSVEGAINPFDYYRSNKNYLERKQGRKHTYGTKRSHVFDFGPDTKKLLDKLLPRRGNRGERDERGGREDRDETR